MSTRDVSIHNLMKDLIDSLPITLTTNLDPNMVKLYAKTLAQLPPASFPLTLSKGRLKCDLGMETWGATSLQLHSYCNDLSYMKKTFE